MKTHIFRGNQYVESFICDGKRYTKWQYRKIKAIRTIKSILRTSAYTLAIVWIAVGTLHIGMARAKTVTVDKEVVKEARIKAPVMERILKCESGNTHIDPKTGQVLQRVNKNGTIDTGKYQINSVWAKKATELGYDLTKENDNESMAYWIYENRGTEDWYSSKKCWMK